MDLSTTYMGLTLKNPIVPSSSPLSRDLEGLRRLEEAGAAAVVLPSLFEEEIIWAGYMLDHCYLDHVSDSFAEALSYFPRVVTHNVWPDAYLELIRRAKEAVQIPVIASLNGISGGGWTRYARLIEQAGADGLELNIYSIPTDPLLPGEEVEQLYVDALSEVRRTVSLPLAMKVSPYFSAFAHVANRLVKQGADALVLFNRFYQPDFDLETMEVAPHLILSQSCELLLPLHWIAILYGRLPVDFAITSGVHTYQDVLKGLMAGASVTMMASELLQHGVHRIGAILAETTRWMEEHEYESVSQMQGSMSCQKVADPAVYERINYVKVLHSFGPGREPFGRS